MAVLSGTFLAPVLAHDASESAFVTGRKVELCVLNHSCTSVSSALLPVCVKAESTDGVERAAEVVLGRRGALVGSAAALAALALSPENASAVQQNQLAGRIPGLSEPDSNGIIIPSTCILPHCIFNFLRNYVLNFWTSLEDPIAFIISWALNCDHWPELCVTMFFVVLWLRALNGSCEIHSIRGFNCNGIRAFIPKT